MSPQRKFRLARTGVILLVLILIVVKCTGDDDPKKATATPAQSSSTTTTAAKPDEASRVTAEVSTFKLPAAHYGTGAVEVGGKIVMPGGLDPKRASSPVVWRFDPTTGQTANVATLPIATRLGAVGAIGDTVWMLGGAVKDKAAVSTTVGIDGSNKLTAPGKLPAVRTDAAGVQAGDGASIYVVGGFDGKNGGANDVLQTTDGTTFTTIATLTQSVRHPALALYKRSIFVIGGAGLDQKPVDVIQRIDLDTKTASEVGHLPRPLTAASAFVLGGSIFVAGGQTAEGRSDQILRIDPVTAVSSEAGKLPLQLSDAMCAVVNDTAYLLGGLKPDPTDAIITLKAS